jgi:membrane protease YdiL (CAAX protease family)
MMYDAVPRLDEPPPEGPRALWGVKEMVICVVVVLVALFIVTTAIVGPFYAAYGEDAPETLTANAIANIVWNATMIAAVLWFVRRAGGGLADLGLELPELSGRGLIQTAGLLFLALISLPVLVVASFFMLGRKDLSWPRILVSAVGTFILMYVIIVVYGVAIDTFGLDFLEPDQQVPDEFYDSDIALAVLGIAIVIGAPVTEEIFFRGFLFGGTRRLTGFVAAALITGFLFSLAHYNLGLIIPFTAIGALLAIAYQRSGSLFVSIGAHFLFNLVSFSILAFVPEARPESGNAVESILHLLGG